MKISLEYTTDEFNGGMTKAIMESPNDYLTLDELFDMFKSLSIAFGYSEKAFNNTVKDYAKGYDNEEIEND